MRPVNLLPEELRPRSGSGGGAGSAYVATGALAALLVAVLAYVLTANQVGSRQEQAASAKRAADGAQRQVAAQGAFADLERTRTSRTATVRQLAERRFAWQRVMADMARALPSGVRLTELDASTSPNPTATPAAGAGAAPSGPSAKLAGCAPQQSDVARLMVRLRLLDAVDDVTLGESGRQDTGGGAGGGEAGASGDCGDSYKFQLTVAFGSGASTTTGGSGS